MKLRRHEASQFFGVIFRNDTVKSTGIALINSSYRIKKIKIHDSTTVLVWPIMSCPKIILFFKALCKNDPKMVFLDCYIAILVTILIISLTH